MTIHTVVSGNTLSGIARQYAISLSELLAANPQISDPNKIAIGQQINIPSPPSPPIRTQPTAQTPPSGPMTLCCPSATRFANPAAATNILSPQGFDDKTHQVDTSGRPYWQGGSPPDFMPAPGSLTEPSPAIPTQSVQIGGQSVTGHVPARNGSSWISVAVGEEIDVDAIMVGSQCIPNVSFESRGPSIVSVSTANPSSTNGPLRIKGESAGEVAIVAKCDGNVIGWFYVWCEKKSTISVNVASIITQNTTGTGSYVRSDLETYMNDVFAPFQIEFNLTDFGVIDLTSLATQPAYSLASADLLSVVGMAHTNTPGLISSYQLYYYVGPSNFLGMVPGGVGAGNAGFAFFNQHVRGAYNTMAHEMGHILNLSHPIHDTDADEFPAYQIQNLHAAGGGVRTNSATGALISWGSNNVLPDHEWNLMGYNGNLAARATSRVESAALQWRKCFRK